jgi:hypothetical protein
MLTAPLWFLIRSKASPTPYTDIYFAPAKLFPQDIVYDVEVELELVRPRLGSDDLGKKVVRFRRNSEADGFHVVVRIRKFHDLHRLAFG